MSDLILALRTALRYLAILVLFVRGNLYVAFAAQVHHVLKDHPYRKLALSLRRSSLLPASSCSSSLSPGRHSQRNAVRVIGLTASYTYAVGDAKVAASLRSMCQELLITNLETATPKELQTNGYHAIGATAEVVLDLNKFSLSQPLRDVVPVANRKPHEMGVTFFRRERAGKLTAFARRLMFCVRTMEKAVVDSMEFPSFTSPLPPFGTLAPRDWGAYAHKLVRVGKSTSNGGGTTGKVDRSKCTRCGRHGSVGGKRAAGDSNRLASTPLRPMLADLEHWYEAAKTLLVSWEEADDEAATILDMGGCKHLPMAGRACGGGTLTKTAGVWPEHVRQAISAFWAEVPDTFPRFEHLKEVLKEKYVSHGADGSSGGTSFRGIVFVRQRVTTHVLAHVISSDPAMASLFSTACLYAFSSPATASLSVTKTQAQAHLESFREGHVNLLLATVVAEEGTDIPAANCTIRFDAMEHAVSLVQGRGRARQEGSSFVVLRERADRTTADLETNEQQQLSLVQNFNPVAHDGDAGAINAAILAAQRSRERSARGVLLTVGTKRCAGVGSLSAGASTSLSGALSAAMLFSKKTKVTLEDSWKKVCGMWVCTLTYDSPLRELSASGEAPGKKRAKKDAAAKLVARLLEVIPA